MELWDNGKRVTTWILGRKKQHLIQPNVNMAQTHIHFDPEDEGSIFLRSIGNPSTSFYNVTIQNIVSEQSSYLRLQKYYDLD
jgi:hypothetical protein